MAENNDEFLKKVYDQYLGSDYEWGDADLNPKREIRKSGEEEWEEEQAAIIDTIEQRIKALQKEAANLPKFKRPEVVDNDNFLTKTSGINGGASPSNDIPLSQLKVQSALGGDLGDNLFLPKNYYPIYLFRERTFPKHMSRRFLFLRYGFQLILLVIFF